MPNSVRGITLLEMMIVVMLIAIIASILVPKLTESKTSANETSAIATLRVIMTAQVQFREGDDDLDTFLDYADSIAELSSVGLIDNVIGRGKKSGYLFSLSGSTYEWQATGTPVNENVGHRSFYIDTTGVVRFALSGTPDAFSAPIGN
ncbi:MAG: prepilin-type N-terminal cleavage/methylation domain-containing protein [Planctomycetota bacterium]|nr:prepilin-type N-terminal cleavage/methylation domain-containing protein [Planctomycetota bacterium]